MVGCSRVGVPVLIGAAGWSREISLGLRRLVTAVGFIEPVIAV
jgi:hypothetical protein